MGGSVEIEGAKELRRALKRLDKGTSDLKAVHRDVAQLVDERARELVPVRSGDLRSTIRPSAGQSAAAVLAGGIRGVPYARPIHFGWPRRHIRPQPFLYEALDERRDQVVKVYEERVAAMVERFDREAPD